MCGHRGGTESYGPKFKKKKKRNLVAAYTFLTKIGRPVSIRPNSKIKSIIGDAKTNLKLIELYQKSEVLLRP